MRFAVALALAVALPTPVASETAAPAPLSQEQLVALAARRVDTKVIVALVNVNCVSFPMDAQAVLDLTSKVPAEAIKAAIECTALRSSAATAPPSPTQTAPPPATAQLRAEFNSNSTICHFFFDYPDPPSSLKARWGLLGQNGPLAQDWEKEVSRPPTGTIAGPWTEEMHRGKYITKTLYIRSGYVEVPSGTHRVSLYCGPRWHRNEITAELLPGKSHTLSLTLGNSTGGLTIRSLRPDE